MVMGLRSDCSTPVAALSSSPRGLLLRSPTRTTLTSLYRSRLSAHRPRRHPDSIDAVRSDALTSLEGLRELSRGIHPAVLSEGGLTAALRSLARRAAVPVDLSLDLGTERFEEPVEVIAYYLTSEALTNTAKHARASRAQISAARRDGWPELNIDDDGRGGADAWGGSGLAGLVDRVEAIGGTIQIDSPADRGTAIQVKLPITSRLS
jgi:signal transduction histidine kinase